MTMLRRLDCITD